MRHIQSIQRLHILAIVLAGLAGCDAPIANNPTITVVGTATSSVGPTAKPQEATVPPSPVTITPPPTKVQPMPTILRTGLDPRATAIELKSTTLGLTKHFYVYAPPHYAEGTERLPVVYLFRGHEREWINPNEDPSRQHRTVIDIYEDLLAQGTVGPMILVFPGIAADDNTWSGLLTNGRQPTLPAAAGKLGTGRWEDYFLQELLPYVDQHYRTNPAARAVDGFSLGGFMAVKIAAQHPDLFQSVGAYDGLYFWDDPANAHSIAITDTTFTNAMFGPVWGVPPDPGFAATNNPLNLVRNGDAARLARLQWLIEYGPESAEPNDSNYYRGQRLVDLLTQKGIVNHGGPIANGRHIWAQADAHMRRSLPLHWKQLNDRH